VPINISDLLLASQMQLGVSSLIGLLSRQEDSIQRNAVEKHFFWVLFATTIKKGLGRKTSEPQRGTMKSKAEEEERFIRSGMAAVEVEHAKYLQSTTATGGKSCVAVPTYAYESLLREAYHGMPLSLFNKDMTVKPVRYDPAKRVFFACDPQDKRLLVPLNVICREIDQRKQEGTPFGAMTSVGAEMMRQITSAEAGGLGGAATATPEPRLFLHDSSGKFVGAGINNEFVPTDQLYQEGLCLVCRSTATKRCVWCKMATYCSVECQTADWPLHKTICGRLESNKGDFVVVRRVEPDPVEVQALMAKLHAVRQLLAAHLKNQHK
jgi:hypothetical protein